jgi:putative zinc finger protein
MIARTCQELRPLLGGYVFEALEPDEAAAVRAHLPDCPACSAELASLAELPHLLDLAGAVAQPAEPLAPSTEEALLDRFARESEIARPRPRERRRRRRLPRFEWTRPRVALASALLAAALAVGVMALVTRDDAPPAARPYVLALHATPLDPGARGHIALYRVRGGTGVRLWVQGLPPGSKQVYEMLCENDRWTASAGTFRADDRGAVEVRLTTAARVGEYDRVRVVTRQRDGTTSDVLTGRLF